MSRRIAVLFALAVMLGTGRAYAQEDSPGPGTVEVTYMPAGAAYSLVKG